MQHSLKPARGGNAGLRTVAVQESEPQFKICEGRRPDAGSISWIAALDPQQTAQGWHSAHQMHGP